MVMEKLNGASNSIVWKFVLGLVAVSFVLSGVAGYVLTQTDTSAVKINGEEVSQQLFQQQYNDEYQRLSQQLGAQFAAVADTPEFINGVRQNVLNRLIDQELLRQYVEELKMSVSDNRVKQHIVSTPTFQVDGKFSNESYQQILRMNGLSADAYAEHVREGLRLEQLQTGLSDTEFTVPVQQEEFARLFFQQRKLRLATLPLSKEINKQSVSEQEVSDFYHSNKDTFMVPETVKVQYIDLTAAEVEKSVQVTEVEVAQYYQDNKAEFSKGEQRLAHIQLTNEKEAQEVYQALQNGADFVEQAKNKSVDKVSAELGGDLGWLSSADLPSAFANSSIGLNIGQYSEPLKVDNTYHIIKVLDSKSVVLPLSEVKERIEAQIRRDLLAGHFSAAEKQMAEKAFENQSSLQAAADAAGVKVQESDYFSRTSVPAELNFPAVISAVFDSDISQGGTNSESMNVGEYHSIVVRVVDHKAAGIRTLEEVKTEIETDLKRQKAEKSVLTQAENLVNQLNHEQQAAKSGLSFNETQTWIYADNQEPVLTDTVFAMPKPDKDKILYQAAKADNGDIVIIALESVEDGKPEEQARLQLDTVVARTQQTDLQNNLLKSLRTRAKIEINQEFINQVEQ